MAKKSLLLVDGDVRSLRVLEVSLRKAGYSLTTCGTAKDALETLEYASPDLILSDTRLPGMDGFGLVEALRHNADWAAIPIMFLSSDTSVESKVRGLQLGVEDYLTKPIYTKEILARIHLALNRRERDSFARGRASLSKTRFTGSLEDMGLVDLLQTIDVSRKSGVLELRSLQGHGTITFREGQILDAELGCIHGERAVYRLLLWSEGDFDIEFRPVRNEAHIATPTTGLLMEGMRRVDEWGRLLEQLPPLGSVLEVVDTELIPRLGEIPDELNPILKAVDGAHTLGEVVDAIEGDDLSTLSALSKLFFEGVIQPSQRVRTLRPTDGPGDAFSVEEAVVGGDVELDRRIAAHRADPDGGGSHVPQTASIVPPPSPLPELETQAIPSFPAKPTPDADGTAGGTPTADGAARGPKPPTKARDPRRTLLGPGFEEATVNRFARFDSPQIPSTPSTSASSPRPPESEASSPASTQAATSSTPDREDHMAKKNRKNRGSERPPASLPPEASKPVEAVAAVEAKRVEVAPPTAKPEERREEKDKREEAASNVIQFPAQAKRAVSQVAVNDDVVPDHDEPTSTDDTQPRLKTDEADKAKVEARPEAKKTDEADKAKVEARPEAKAETKSERPPESAKSEPPARGTDDEPREDRREKRKKKAAITESGEMRALGTGDHAVVTEEFFTTKKKSAPVEHDDFADLQRSLEPMSAERKQAMWATAGIVLVGLLAIGSYYYYHNYHMPQPVQLGRAGPVEMPRLGGPNGTPSVTTEAPPATTEATPPATTEVAPPATTEVAPPATTEVAPPATTETAPPATTETAPPATTETAPAETYESVLAQAVAARGAARQMPLLQRAIELNPNGADALARLSYIYIQRPGRANMEQARSLAERATAADPTSAQGWLVLGAARSELGDRAGARAAFDACVAQGTGRHVAECRASR